jgi:4'-phosphopantetheinyl transferase EntD
VRAAAIAHPAARARFVAGRWLLRETIAEVRPDLPAASLELEVERTGRLRLRGHPELEVSISHTRGLVAVAVSTAGPVGIDVEQAGRGGLPPAETWLTQAERSRLGALDVVARAHWLLRLWVAKEAALKAVPSRTLPRRRIEIASDGTRAYPVDALGWPDPDGPVLGLQWVGVGARHLLALAGQSITGSVGEPQT